MMLSKDELFNTLVDIDYEIITDNEGYFRDTIKNVNSLYIFTNEEYYFDRDEKRRIFYDLSKQSTENLKIVVYDKSEKQ